MGISAIHSSNVPLVLNLTTGHISPQFHVVFDDFFSTVMSIGINDEPPNHWENFFHESRFEALFDEHDKVELADEWLEPDDIARRRHLRKELPVAPLMNLPIDEIPSQHQREFLPLQNTVDDTSVATITREQPPTPQQKLVSTKDTTMTPTLNSNCHVPTLSSTSNPVPIPPDSPPAHYSKSHNDPGLSTLCRSTRSTQGIPPKRLIAENYLSQAFFSQLIDKSSTVCETDLNLAYLATVMTDPTTGLLDCTNPIVYAAMARKLDPDNPRYHQAMASSDSDAFREAMVVEIKALTSKKTWTLVPRSSLSGKKVLPGTWAFKRKLFPDGRLRKCKARFCVRGDMQIEGVDYFETYAPVVQWSTVRALLIMSLVLGLETVQIDFSNAFCQADIEEEIYVEMPKDFGDSKGRDMVLKLKKSLYGTKQAPRTWFLKLKQCLEMRGFHQSELDPCLFIHPDMVYIVYVDDSILIGRDRSKIEAMIADLSTELDLTCEGDLAAFLGIQISRSPLNGSMTLTQEGLITGVLNTTGLLHSHSATTPANKEALGSDSNGPPAQEHWDYRSVVGMLMYFASNSCPDIAFAAHQCACFSHCPKASHEVAVKKICWYLKGTLNRGIIYTPTSSFSADCYCDSDFVGLFGRELSNDPICAKSCTGYVITLSGCPLLWVSKLQTTIALSTMEAEYTALSSSCRDLIPL